VVEFYPAARLFPEVDSNEKNRSFDGDRFGIGCGEFTVGWAA
jgi:hypothetical protein